MSGQNILIPQDANQSGLRRVVRLFAPIAIIMAVLGVLPRLFGANLDPVAASMPIDTIMYMEVDTLNLVSQDSLRIAESFQEIFEEAEIEFDSEDPNQFIDEFQERFFVETGLSIEEDILPWLGPNVGVGILEFDLNVLDFDELPPVIMGVSVRDTQAADAFIPKMLDALDEDVEVAESVYEGVQIYNITDQFSASFSFARVGRLFTLTTSEMLVQQVVDAQAGESLASSDLYKETIEQLPENRILSVYISGEGYGTFLNAIEDDPSLPEFQLDTLTQLLFDSVGMSISTNVHGFQIDAKALYSELPNAQRAFLEAQEAGMGSAELLPEETMMLISGQRLDLYWDFLQENLEIAGFPEEDVNEAVALLGDQIGFHLIDDLLPILDGEYAIAVMESTEGQIAAQSGLNIGAMLLLETSDSPTMLSLVESLNESIVDLAGLPPRPITHPEAAVYEISNPFLGGQLVAYGVSDTHFILSSSNSDINLLLSDKASLADSEIFQATWAAFPENMNPSFYMDVEIMIGLLASFDPTIEDAVTLNPVSIVAGGSQLDDDVIGSTIIIFIP